MSENLNYGQDNVYDNNSQIDNGDNDFNDNVIPSSLKCSVQEHLSTQTSNVDVDEHNRKRKNISSSVNSATQKIDLQPLNKDKQSSVRPIMVVSTLPIQGVHLT